MRHQTEGVAEAPVTKYWSDEETDNPLRADDRNFYKVEKWTKDGAKINRLLYAGSNLEKARKPFAGAINRPRLAAPNAGRFYFLSRSQQGDSSIGTKKMAASDEWWLKDHPEKRIRIDPEEAERILAQRLRDTADLPPGKASRPSSATIQFWCPR